jgi:tetratricopeptide (TPR) repeat protein
MLRQKERYEEAVAAYDTAIGRVKQVEKRHWPLFYARGIGEERSKQWAKAETDFNKALELEPDQAYVLNYLGYSWIDMNRNLDEGLAMIKKAVELRPDDGYIIDSLGWAYFRLGKFDDATEELERAAQIKAGDATINDHLGDAYWRVGRKLEAVYQWNRALGSEPEAAEIPKIKDKIANGLPAVTDDAKTVDKKMPDPAPVDPKPADKKT